MGFKRGPKGFSIWFEHAGVSVQFGPGNYCEHYEDEHYGPAGIGGFPVPIPSDLISDLAEVAIISTSVNGPASMITGQWDPDASFGVKGWCSAAEVASAIAWAAAYVPTPAASGDAPCLAAVP